MISDSIELMRHAIREARHSVNEDDRLHPNVGAVLVDKGGHIVLRAHRGDGAPGNHAEFALLREVERRSIDASECSLFVTLEPCVHRTPAKIPCAERIIKSGIQQICFGMLDPNPVNRGRGEILLRRAGLIVNRFPHELIRIIETDNAAFLSRFHYTNGFSIPK